MSLLIPKLQELKPTKLHFVLMQLKAKMKAVENISAGIYANLDVLDQVPIDYDDSRDHDGGSIDTYVLDGLLTSIRMHTDHIGVLLHDVTKSFNIHDVEGSEGGTL